MTPAKIPSLVLQGGNVYDHVVVENTLLSKLPHIHSHEEGSLLQMTVAHILPQYAEVFAAMKKGER